MKTIGYGLVQIPVVTRYRVCCIKRTLAGGVTSTAWQQILGCTVRILLLSSWGLQSIDYSLPQTAEKIVGVYIEFTLLSLQVVDGITLLFGLWADNIYLLYPSLVIIPSCFLVDIIVKATCYAALFLTPEVTPFGILSLIEVWFRGLSLMYGWVIIVSFIYYKRKDWNLTEIEVKLNRRSPNRVSMIAGGTVAKSPFSRNSSFSQRGRRSFLLRKESGKNRKGENKDTETHLMDLESVAQRDIDLKEGNDASLQRTEFSDETFRPQNSFFGSERNVESEILLGESATMSLKKTSSPGGKRSTTDRTGSPGSNLVSPTSRYKKRGGFVPDVLRLQSNMESSDELRNVEREDIHYTQGGLLHSGSNTVPNALGDGDEGSSFLRVNELSDQECKPILNQPYTCVSKKSRKETKKGPGKSQTKRSKVQEKSVAENTTALGKKYVPVSVLV